MRKTVLGLIAPIIVFVSIGYSTANHRTPVSSCQESPTPDKNRDDHVGPVESIRIEDAELAFTEKPHLRQISKFNPLGQKIESVSYLDNGFAQPRSTFSYDSTNHLIKVQYHEANGSIFLEHTYTYSADGRLKDDIQRSPGRNKIVGRKIYSHDAKRNSTEVSDFDWDDKLRVRSVLIRNAMCQIIEGFVYNPDSSLLGRIVLSYDDKNNVIERVTYSSDKSIKEKVKNDYEFDNRGNWIKQISSEWVIDDGKGFYKPVRATYRKITYY